MPQVNTKEEFIDELKKYTSINSQDTISFNFENKTIIIEETENDGQGEIYLDISAYADEVFFIKIENISQHNIGLKQNHNDGIVLKINLKEKSISVFLFELKKQLRFNKLEKASRQLESAYKFIKYINLEECFIVEYNFFIVYEINNLKFDADVLKTANNFKIELFNSVYQNKTTIPLQIPLCKFKKYNFQQIQFGRTIRI